MRGQFQNVSRFPVAIFVAAAFCACSGGGGDPPASCTRAAIPATGPGDTLDYFPSQVGWHWAYQVVETGQTGTMDVTGTQVVGTETAAVFTSVTGGGAPSTELVVERPAGAYVLADGSESPPFDQLYPSLILPFPVAPTPAVQQVRCASVAAGDLDGDGRADTADIVSSLQILSITESMQVAAGSFTDLAHAHQVADVTVHATSAGAVHVTAVQDDWFAAGVGRVYSTTTLTATGYQDTQTITLVSWTPPPVAVASRAMGAGGAEPARTTRLEERALDAARTLLR